MSAPERRRHSKRRGAREKRRRPLRSRLLLVILTLFATGGLVLVLPAAVDAAPNLTTGAWWVSSTQTGAGATYGFIFGTPTSGGSTTTSVTMTVPAGTTGPAAPAFTLSAITATGATGYAPNLGTETASFNAGTSTLTISFASTYLNPSTHFWIQVSGLTNTTTAGSYTSTISTMNGATVTSPAVVLGASQLAAVYWSTSATTKGATGVTYSYALTTATSATLDSIVLSVPPGTGGSAALASISGLSNTTGDGATLNTGTDTITVSFAAQSIPAATRLVFSISGLTNTAANGQYGEEAITESSGSPVDTAALAVFNVTYGALTNVSWSPSATGTGSTGVAYTYNFTLASGTYLDGFQFSVPPGTGGSGLSFTYTTTPSLTIPAAATTTLSSASDTLTIAFPANATYYGGGSVFSITVNGLTNSSTAGSYAAWVTTLAIPGNYFPTVDSGVAGAATFSGTTLTPLAWSVSSSAVSATNTTYTYNFGFTSSSTFDTVKMTVPPGTAGTPSVGTVTPGSVAAGGAVSLSGGELVYTFTPPATVGAVQTVTITIGGLTNTATAGSYSSTLTVLDGATVVASGTTAAVSFTNTVLTGVGWTATPSTAAATGAAYVYTLTTASGANLTAITMSVPPGTAGTPTLGPISISPSYISLTSTAVALNPTLNVLTFSFASQYFPSGAQLSIEIDSLTNTPTGGNYSSSVTTKNGSAAVDSGTSSQVDFTNSALNNASWLASNNGTGATGVTYTFGFQVPTSIMLDTITMTVPSGTGGTPTVSSVSPAALAGGTVTRTSGLLTYTVATPVSLAANATVSLAFGAVTNTATGGSYTSTISASDQGTAIASGTTAAVSFTSTVLTALSWGVSSTRTSAAGVTDTFSFTTGSTASLQSVKLTVPLGTGVGGGGLTITTATPSAIAGGTASLNTGTGTITYTMPGGSVYVASGTAITLAFGDITNPASPATATSTISTIAATTGHVQDSGTTNAITFVGGSLPGLTWQTANPQVQASGVSYTWTFTTASSSVLTGVQMTVPNGTSYTGTSPSVGGATSAPFSTGASATLAGTTLTLSFTAASVSAGTPVTIQIGGLVNTSAAGSYTSVVTTEDGASSIDTGTSGGLWFLPIPTSGQFQNACPAPPLACATSAGGGTQLILVAIPGGPAATASVVLSVTANDTAGYRVQAETSTLPRSGGGSPLAEAPTSGAATLPSDALAATASLAGSGSSGAALCPPYGSATPYVGYASSPLSIWHATGSTGAGTDTVTMTATVQVGITQPAGSYTGTISYELEPGSSTC